MPKGARAAESRQAGRPQDGLVALGDGGAPLGSLLAHGELDDRLVQKVRGARAACRRGDRCA